MPDDTRARQRLGTAVRSARLAADLSQQEAASRARISLISWGAVERSSRRPSERTLLAIDRGLGWPEGTASRVLAGAKPPPKTAPLPAADLEQIAGALQRIEQLLSEILHRLPERGAHDPA